MNPDANNHHFQQAAYGPQPNRGNFQPQQLQLNQQKLWHPQQHYHADYSQQYGQPYAPNCGYPSTNCLPTAHSHPNMERFEQQQQNQQQLWQQQHYQHADYLQQQNGHGQLYYAPNGYTGTIGPTTQQQQQQTAGQYSQMAWSMPMGVDVDVNARQNEGYAYLYHQNVGNMMNSNMNSGIVHSSNVWSMTVASNERTESSSVSMQEISPSSDICQQQNQDLEMESRSNLNISTNSSSSEQQRDSEESFERGNAAVKEQIDTKKFLLEEIEKRINVLLDKLRYKQDPDIQSELKQRVQKSEALRIELNELYNRITAANLPCPSSSLPAASNNNSPVIMELGTSSAPGSSQQSESSQQSQINEQNSLAALTQQLEQIKRELNVWQDQNRLFITEPEKIKIDPIEAEKLHFQKLTHGENCLQEKLTRLGINLLDLQKKNDANASAIFTEFLHCLPIIRVQPPPYIVCYDHMAVRKSKYWFDVSIELLCKDFLCENGFKLKSAKCELIDENNSEKKQFILADKALRKQIKRNAHLLMSQEVLQPLVMEIETDYKITAKELAIIQREDDKRILSGHCYKIRISIEIGSHLVIANSLEIDIHSNKPEEPLIRAALKKRLFKNQDTVKPQLMMDAVEMLFQYKLKSIASTIPDFAYEYVPLSERARKFLLQRITNNANTPETVSVDDLFERTFNEEKEKPFTFLEWLYGAAKILCVNKTVYEMWKKRLIYGFCSREEASLHVRCCADAVLVRFANFDYSRESGTSAFSVDALTRKGTVLPSPITIESFENSSNDQHFALVCGGIKLYAKNKDAPLSAGYFGSKCRIVRWIVESVQKLNFEHTHTVKQRGTVDFGTECLNVRRKGDANATENLLKRGALSPKTTNGNKKSKPAKKLHPPLGPDDITLTHANERNETCRVIFNYESNMKIREGDAMIVEYMDQKFIVEASHDEVDGVNKVKYHHSE